MRIRRRREGRRQGVLQGVAGAHRFFFTLQTYDSIQGKIILQIHDARNSDVMFTIVSLNCFFI